HVVGADGGTSLDPAGYGSGIAGIEGGGGVVGRGADAFPLAARLEKRIPVAAGLAGGSSAAAAAIDGALAAWGADPPGPDRLRAAAAVGSDVPFFLAGVPALVEGRGEKVTPLTPFKGAAPAVVLVTPPIEASTARAFALVDTDPAAAPGSRGSTRLSSEHLAAELGPRYPPVDGDRPLRPPRVRRCTRCGRSARATRLLTQPPLSTAPVCSWSLTTSRMRRTSSCRA